MTIKLVAIDLDETLLRPDKTYDRERFNRVLHQLEDLDIHVVIATGNSYHKIGRYFDDYEIDKLYIGADNGNYIMHQNKLWHRTKIDPESFKSVVEFITELPDIYVAASDSLMTYIQEPHNQAIKDLYISYNPAHTFVDDLASLAGDHDFVKLPLQASISLEQMKVLTRILNERYPRLSSVTSGDNWIDIYSVDGGKGSAVRYLQEAFNVDKDETMAFGDSLNDESMFHEAGYAVAMANADPDLVRVADYQIGSNLDQAVITTLEELVANNGDPNFLAAYKL